MTLWERIPEKRRIWVWIGLGLLAVILLATLLWPKRQARELTGENLLKDGNFAEYALKGSGAWYEDAYVNRSTYTAYDFVTEADGGVSAHIAHMLANDARFAQIVDVRPDSLYCLEGDVKANAQGGGARTFPFRDLMSFRIPCMTSRNGRISACTDGRRRTSGPSRYSRAWAVTPGKRRARPGSGISR